MAIGDPYITTDDLAAYLGVTSSSADDMLRTAVQSASGWVNRHCAREFNKTTTAAARVFAPDEDCLLDVDDFHTITDLVVKSDDNNDGTYGTTWTTADYVLEPFNGMENSRPGFPYRRITAVNAVRWPAFTGRPRAQVTAQWGWAAVPAEVKQATRILAAEIYRLKDAPLGVAGFNDFGPVRVREVPQVVSLLADFQHPVRTVAVG